nr:capsid protein [Rat picobirnavirus]
MNSNKKVAKKHYSNRRFSNKAKAHDCEAQDSRRKSKFDSGERVDTTHAYNDVSWYTKNSQMLEDSASYSYNQALGAKLKSPWEGYETVNAIPGVLGLRIMPTIGRSDGSISPANLCANNIYAFVRSRNSGAANYDQADLMIYLLAMDSLYSAWNWLKRIYGYASVYSQYNRYMPEGIAEIENVNIQDIVQNLADFRWFLNNAAAKIGSFCVPAVMPYFIRHSWMYSSIYKDSNNMKAQLMMFTPDGFYTYTEKTSKYGGMLKYSKVGVNSSGQYVAWTAQSLRNYLNLMLQAVSYSEDIAIISGDILKAYGENSLFKLTPVDADYSVEPTYNEEVLNQMHNSTCIGTSSTANYDITQDPDSGYLVWNPEFASQVASRHSFFVNMPWDNVTPSNTMVGTRLCAAVQKMADNSWRLYTCGSEIVVSRWIAYWSFATGTAKLMLNTRENEVVLNGANYAASWVKHISLLSQFDWHPLMWVLNNENSTNTVLGVVGDVSNYTLIDVDSMDSMHTTAIMSEFNIPEWGTF